MKAGRFMPSLVPGPGKSGRGSSSPRLLLTRCGQRVGLAFANALDPDIRIRGAEEMGRSQLLLRRWIAPGRFEGIDPVTGPLADERAFVEDVVRLCRSQAMDAVYSVGHFHTLALATHKAEIESRTKARVLLDHPSTLRTLCDKWELTRLAGELDIPTPRTALLDTEDKAEDVAAAHGMIPPFLVKPRNGMGGMGIRLIRSPGRIVPLGRRIRDGATLPFFQDLLLQERHAGVLHGVNILSAEGRVLASGTQEALVLDCEESGFGVVARTTEEPDLLRAGERIVTRLGYTGLVNLDFLKDGEGRFWLLDANPRPWGSFQLMLDAGLNMAQLWMDAVAFGRADVTRRSCDPGVTTVLLLPECLLAWFRPPVRPRFVLDRIVRTFGGGGRGRRVVHFGYGRGGVAALLSLLLNRLG